MNSWQNQINSTIQTQLQNFYHRPITIQQSTPLPDDEHFFEIFFNDLIFNQLQSDNPAVKPSYRFGFFWRQIENKNENTIEYWAGFSMYNPIVALNSFVRNARHNSHQLALSLHSLLNESPDSCWFWLTQGANDNFMWEKNCSVEEIKKAIDNYGNPEWETNHIHRNMECFDAETELSVEFRLNNKLFEFTKENSNIILTPSQILPISQEIFEIYQKLDFIYYQMWSYDTRGFSSHSATP